MRAQFRRIGATFASTCKIFRSEEMLSSDPGGPKRVRIHGTQVFPSETSRDLVRLMINLSHKNRKKKRNEIFKRDEYRCVRTF